MPTFVLMFKSIIFSTILWSLLLLTSCEDETAPAVAYLEVTELRVAAKASEGI